MEKVIIIHGAATIGLRNAGTNEYSYQPAEILAALQDGYTVKSVNTITTEHKECLYAVVFVLTK